MRPTIRHQDPDLGPRPCSGPAGVARLRRLFDEHGQSPWLDNLTRLDVQDGTLARLVTYGIRGATANLTTVARAIESTDAYDHQLHALVTTGTSIEAAYWELAIADVVEALRIMRPTFDASGGKDGFVSLEVAPRHSRDSRASVEAARALRHRIAEPNLMVKIPATDEGVPAIRTMIGEGDSTNATLVFSLGRYRQVLEAYLSGLEDLAGRGGDLASVRSVASFSLSRLDTEVDQRIEQVDTERALSLRGQAAVAQAKAAYQLFCQVHSGARWNRLAKRGAQVQRLLWTSTSPKNPTYSDTLYVDNLIGPQTVNNLAGKALDAFEDHGALDRTIDRDLPAAQGTLRALAAAAAIDLDDIGQVLEEQGMAAFHASYRHALLALGTRANTLLEG